MNKEQLKKELLQEFRKYQRMIEQVEIMKQQFSLDLDHEIQNKMRKGR